MVTRFLNLALLSLNLAAMGQHAAFADAATEAQLRAALQSSTAQIAQLEDQVANLQASQAPNVATIEALRAQLQTLQASKPASAPALPQNDAELSALKRQLAAQRDDLSKSQTAYQSASNSAGSMSAENTDLKSRLSLLNAELDSCGKKNSELYTVGNQILNAYSHKDDLFGSIADREPFTGLKRVQLQNIVQNDQDRLDDNRITPAP